MEAALITGASSGIGKAIALRLAKDGYFIWIHYNQNQTGALQVKSLIEQNSGKGEILSFNVTEQEIVSSAIQSILSKDHPPLTVLVNNAGIIQDNLFALMKDSQWKEVLDTGLLGFYNVTKPIVRYMIARRKGNIVNIVSLSGQIGPLGQSNYAAAKAGLIAATQSVSKEVARNGIRVNAVSPGFIQTEMIQDNEKIQAMIKNTVPMQRPGTPEEVANVVAFLCSKEASYVNGAVVNVNGGMF